MKESQVKRGRGRPRKTIRKIIRKDLEVNELDPNLVYDRTLASFDPCSRHHLME